MLLVSYPKEANSDSLLRAGKGFRGALQNTHHHSYHLLTKHSLWGKIIHKEVTWLVRFWLGRAGGQDLRKDGEFTSWSLTDLPSSALPPSGLFFPTSIWLPESLSRKLKVYSPLILEVQLQEDRDPVLLTELYQAPSAMPGTHQTCKW